MNIIICRVSKLLLNFNLYFDKINNIVNVEEVEFKRLNTCIKKAKSHFLIFYLLILLPMKRQKPKTVVLRPNFYFDSKCRT